ncbi:MAG TPA: conjugative transposon protein TraM [Puia sp.]|nr:conjugative transposon protein TraM [Puia sp.]
MNKKFLLVLPLLVLPFIFFIFWVLGGGKENYDSGAKAPVAGMNVKLPDPHFKKGAEKSKLSLYEEASKDSVLLRDKMKNDPYYTLKEQDLSFDTLKVKMADENESKILDKLNKLKSVINQKPYVQKIKSESFDSRLAETKPAPARDPHMEQISSMLDKIMAIQHPEIMQDSMARLNKQNTIPAFKVNLEIPDANPESFSTDQEKADFAINRFYDLAEDPSIEKNLDDAIEAEIPETQTLVSGSTIKLRLLNDIRINGHLIGKNQLVYGTATLNGERLKIQFSSVRSGQNILPVSLEAYDLDGLAGIYIPGSINRDVAKQSTDQAIGSVGLTSLDPSLSAQAAGAGIQAAKTLLSRKIKLVKVTVKAGYRVLLKDSKEK